MRKLRVLWRSVHGWFASSAPVTRRQFFAAFLLLFLLATVTLAGEGNLVRSNHEQIRANRALTLTLEQQVEANRALTQRLGRIAREGQRARRSLCALEDDLRRRIAAAEAFLRSHPNGIDGITPSVIRNSIKQQQQTIRALGPRRLDCSPPGFGGGHRPDRDRPH